MLRCSDGRYYVGVTNDITYRIDQHQNGTSKTAYTYKRRPVKLVYSAQFNDINEAISWEKHIKRWSHAKKTALITADEKQLHDFSKCMNESHAENMEKDRRALSSRAETRDDLFRVMVRLRSP